MIAASLAVIAIILSLLHTHQSTLQQEKIRVFGVAITRALSGVEYAQLVPEAGHKSLVDTLTSVQGSENFAYGVVVNLEGQHLFETASAGTLIPDTRMPTEPAGWIGEHFLNSPGDNRQIREFFAPAMRGGELAGFVRVGYYNESAYGWGKEISYFALMALPIFLLTAASYFMIRREIRPLAQLSEKMEQATHAYGISTMPAAHGQDLGDFIQRFDQFIQLVQSRVQQADTESVSTQTSARLLGYKQEKAESALNAIPEAVLVIDDTCIPTFVNSKVEAVLGVASDEIIGHAPQTWCKNEEVLAFLIRFNQSTTSTRTASLEYTPDTNPDRRFSVSAFPLFSPRDKSVLFGRLIIFHDISNEHLAKKAGSEFVAHVSHELKTPLNTLAAYSELLLDYTLLDDAQRVEAVNVIHDEAERMAGLINNLLNISKLETGTLKLDRKRVKIHDLLQDAIDRMNKNAFDKGITIELNMPPDLGSARLDKDLFRIAIDNLLSNAIKYSNPGSRVILSAQNPDNDLMTITVRDQGIGISAEDCEKVFLKYYRSNSSDVTSRSGHGLGLYLVKQIIEMHHGAVSVSSELGKGTEFCISFKAQPVLLEESRSL